MRRILISMLVMASIIIGSSAQVYATEEIDQDGIIDEKKTTASLELTSTSVILMELSTGTILYEENADVQMAPASVTKVMTMLLIFEAIEKGQISLEDEVITSEYAASMGGSQVFLEAGEMQTVDTMLKCIAVASANDSCVAMAEYISGSEELFVEKMNLRAKELGMINTTFINCNGLDAIGHLTTASDIALMSKELMTAHPQVEDYTMIWTENITHVTKKGSSEFGLSNTNKLVRYYEYTTGLKTGYTSEAKFCISATAKKDDIDLVAVVMGAPSSANRNSDAIKLFNYGFANCQKYVDDDKIEIDDAIVSGGIEESVEVEVENQFTYIDTQMQNFKDVRKEITLYDGIAPIKKGEVMGKLEYYLEDKLLGEVSIVAKSAVDEMKYIDALTQVWKLFLL